MKKLIGITLSIGNGKGIEKILEILPKEYELINLDSDADERLLDCEIVFGYVNMQVLAKSTKLRWLHTQTAGVDYILNAKTPLADDVLLTNSSGCYGPVISEHLLTTSLMLLRDMGGYYKKQLNKTWEYQGGVRTIFGANVLVVGLGDIGSCFAKHCKNLGANVTGIVRTSRPKPDYLDKLSLMSELDNELLNADIVAICLPGTNETKGLFDTNRFKKMKSNSIILNVGRGNIIKTDDLILALKNGIIGGAGLDVVDPEPLPQSSELWHLPNVVITPHISGRDKMGITSQLIIEKFITNLKEYLQTSTIKNTINKNAGY